MRVLIFPADNSGCGNYRLRWPAAVLASQGKDVRIAKQGPAVIMRGDRVVDVLPIEADVVVFQRPSTLAILDGIVLLQKKGIKVVVEVDDYLAGIDPMNHAYGAYSGAKQHWRYTSLACEIADLVTVTTVALAELYGGVVIPQCIPKAYLQIRAERDPMCTVGWPGFVGVHPNDLQITHGAVNEALSAQPARFLAIGDRKALDHLGIRNRPPHAWINAVPLDRYPHEVARLDIGIVPLADTPFNRAKSRLKALEYAALGVAPVVSGTPDNLEMVQADAALLADSPRAWKETIRELIADESGRAALTKRAYEFASLFTIEANAWRWWSAWSSMFA